MTTPADLAQVAQEWVEESARLGKLQTHVDELADYLRAHITPGEHVATDDGVRVGVWLGAARWTRPRPRNCSPPSN